MFDIQKFTSVSFVARTLDVEVSALQEFFPDGVKAVFRVQGLSGEEVARAQHEAEQNKLARRAASAVADSADNEIAGAVRVLLGSLRTGVDIPDKHVLHLHMVHAGIIEPKLDYTQVVRFATFFPVEFTSVTQAVLELTGMGYTQKKH